MSEIKESALELIGGTPILKLNGYAKKREITEATVLAKLEYLNPAGSVKDRIALASCGGKGIQSNFNTS